MMEPSSPFFENLPSIVFKTPSVPLLGDKNLPYPFSKITPSLFFDKASCTRQFESELSLHSLASLFPLKEGSTSHLGLLQWSLHPLRFPRLRGTETSGKKRETALQCSEPLCSKVGGASKPSPCCAGWDRRGNSSL